MSVFQSKETSDSKDLITQRIPDDVRTDRAVPMEQLEYLNV